VLGGEQNGEVESCRRLTAVIDKQVNFGLEINVNVELFN
jgi:hypothetical protein